MIGDVVDQIDAAIAAHVAGEPVPSPLLSWDDVEVVTVTVIPVPAPSGAAAANRVLSRIDDALGAVADPARRSNPGRRRPARSLEETSLSKLVFVDTETTGLDSNRHEIWEIAAIVRGDDGDQEYAWQIRPSLKTADPAGLRVGRYYQRCSIVGQPVDSAVATAHPEHTNHWSGWAHHVAEQLAPLLDGATLVGAVPDFDARFLTRFLRRHEQAPTWHYHLVDVETLAAGALGIAPPWGFDDLLAAYGLIYDEADRHTALGDARMVRNLYDAVFARRVVAVSTDSVKLSDFSRYVARVEPAAEAGA